jgi:hypothetical protein
MVGCCGLCGSHCGACGSASQEKQAEIRFRHFTYKSISGDPASGKAVFGDIR